MTRYININVLVLPQDLLNLVSNGHWKCPADLSKIESLFPDRSDFCLYSIDYMPFENAHWLNETNPLFIGEADSNNPPGDIDPRRSLLIGDLGVGYDQPFALDYRVSETEPRVLTLIWSTEGRANKWIEIAPHIRQFAELVGL